MGFVQDGFGLKGSIRDYYAAEGDRLEERSALFHEWLEARRRLGVLPYNRILMSQASHMVAVANEFGDGVSQYINFGSQDYLGLAQDHRVHQAACEAIEHFGVHSAGSAVLAGRTGAYFDLAERLATALKKEACTIFPTGWAAGFGVLTGLVRESDAVVIDALAHNCLQEGSRHATKKVYQFGHNDVEHLDDLLTGLRADRAKCGLFVVIESLYSMDSDGPDLNAVLHVVRRHGGILILDVAHDFGAVGRSGFGLLESLRDGYSPDVIMGSFSKTFASNGGFVASSRRVRDYLSFNAAPLMFSNALSPMQALVVSRCMDIAFSDEGAKLRERLLANIQSLRQGMADSNFRLGGKPSPIVPVLIGNEAVARLTSQHLQAKGLLANLVEYPAVATGTSRFRFQLMSNHDHETIGRAVRIMAESYTAAVREAPGRAALV